MLIPKGDGTWQLKPRTATDAVANHPTVTVAEARALPAGKTVAVRGIALNGWVTFGDASVHVKDATGSIRIVNLPTATIFAGDSVRIIGTVAIVNGQPVLVGVGSAILLAGVGVPAPPVVSTLVASTANTGALDAAQVEVTGTISVAAPDSVVVGDVLLTISDGTGNVVVRLDRDVGFANRHIRNGSAYPGAGRARARIHRDHVGHEAARAQRSDDRAVIRLQITDS